MKRVVAFVKKEFLHVFRDPKTMLMLFGLPVIQILLFGFALSNEIKNAPVLIMDYSQDASSRLLTDKFRASPYFDVVKSSTDRADLESEFRKGNIQLAIILPIRFMQGLTSAQGTEIQLIADASNPNTATGLVQYASGIIRSMQMESGYGGSPFPVIRTETRMIYNPELSSARNFVPGLIALILLLICVLMTSVSIVREKEKGNMEVLLVSPVNPWIIVISKAIPYLILSLLNLGIILILSVFLLKIPIAGSLTLLVGESILLIVTALALGLLISTLTDSQETAMMISLMGMLLPTLLFTGFLFPLENMPIALQYFANLIPSRWYYVIANDIMIKGLGIAAVWKETLILAGMAMILLILSIRSFKTRLT